MPWVLKKLVQLAGWLARKAYCVLRSTVRSLRFLNAPLAHASRCIVARNAFRRSAGSDKEEEEEKKEEEEEEEEDDDDDNNDDDEEEEEEEEEESSLVAVWREGICSN